MSEITLQAGQVWVPTKGLIGRKITWVQNPHIEWHNNRRSDVRTGQTVDFRAWITRTGAVLRSEAE
jgi:hypothetical protein